MQAFLLDKFGDTGVDHWVQAVEPQIKEAVIASVLSGQEWLTHRKNSHTLLGYDLMLDEMLNVWLIEINSSPAMDFSTPITEKLVTQLLGSELPKLIIDAENGKLCLDGENRTGNFERIYNQ